jgi:glutaminyl-peptide cyclotransferase
MTLFNGKNAWDILARLAADGMRAPGTDGHRQGIAGLKDMLGKVTEKTWLQEFTLPILGQKAQCANICGLIRGINAGYTVLIGSHFDTRWIADNESDPELKTKPIPGVNDGTSGVAVILELARVFSNGTLPACNVVFALFDAEDVGNIDGHDFSMGADLYARQGLIRPNLAIALDMVAGKDMHLNVDVNSLVTAEAVAAFSRLFALGRSMKYPAFTQNTPMDIISDHYPFVRRNIPAVLLIDLTYPQWHTHADTLENCCEYSLKQVGDVLCAFLADPVETSG